MVFDFPRLTTGLPGLHGRRTMELSFQGSSTGIYEVIIWAAWVYIKGRGT